MNFGWSLRFKTYVLICAMLVFGPLGDVLLGKAMKKIPPMNGWKPAGVLRFFVRAFTSPTAWLGIASLMLFFLAYLLVLSWADYTYVQPASALSYGLVALLAVIALNERITPTRWGGVLLICLGVFAVGQTVPRTTEPR
ncbi:MAG: EamA family transporter [Candidatus Acidiferrales bacterium]